MINCVQNGIEMHNDVSRVNKKEEEDGKREWTGKGRGRGRGKKSREGKAEAMLRELTSQKSLTLDLKVVYAKRHPARIIEDRRLRGTTGPQRERYFSCMCVYWYSIGDCLFPFLGEERSKRETQPSVRGREK